ncbi:Lrp/AsnC family transcriptional regulator [Teichococcus aestuarii]|uniref:Lrp/AsnC family transcriptional regulator n=1 Tax=Teichococcus aestuarii TaxID=568898 RepID=UPI00361F7A42
MHGIPTLDGFDLKLLMALQEDGRLTNQQLGERVGLSPRNARGAARRWRRRG